MTKLQVVATSHMPILTILQSFWTTAVVNVISWNKAYSIYPMATLGEHRAYIQRSLQGQPILCSFLPKYEQRGWTLFHDEPPDVRLPQPSQSIRQTRAVNDRFTLIIPLRTDGIVPAETPDYVLELSHFNISPCKREIESFEGQDITYDRYSVNTNFLVASVLKHGFVCGPAWRGWLGKMMDYKTLEELHKLPVSLRPLDFSHLVQEPKGIHKYLNIVRPDTWKYYDYEIPELFEHWTRTMTHPLP